MTCTFRHLQARTDMIHEGQASKDVRLVLEGFACRYKLLANGKRQIVAYLFQATSAICTSTF